MGGTDMSLLDYPNATASADKPPFDWKGLHIRSDGAVIDIFSSLSDSSLVETRLRAFFELIACDQARPEVIRDHGGFGLRFHISSEPATVVQFIKTDWPIFELGGLIIDTNGALLRIYASTKAEGMLNDRLHTWKQMLEWVDCYPQEFDPKGRYGLQFHRRQAT